VAGRLLRTKTGSRLLARPNLSGRTVVVMTATLTRVCLPPDCARAAVETSAATRYDYRHAFDIDTLFWGALIFLALFLSCFLAWKAIEWLRNPTKTVVRPRPQPTVLTADGEHKTEPYVPETKPSVPQGFGRALGDGSSLSHMTYMAGFSEREEEEFLLMHGPKKVRKAIEERRKAGEQAKNQSN
jgi:hypothetical protein